MQLWWPPRGRWLLYSSWSSSVWYWSWVIFSDVSWDWFWFFSVQPSIFIPLHLTWTYSRKYFPVSWSHEVRSQAQATCTMRCPLIIILCSKNVIVKVDYQMKSGSMHNYSWHWLTLVPIAIGIEIKVAKIFSKQYEKIIWHFMIAKYWGILYNPSTQFFAPHITCL